MNDEDEVKQKARLHTARIVVDAVAFLAGIVLGTVVFENFALGLVFALIFSGGSEAIHRRST